MYINIEGLLEKKPTIPGSIIKIGETFSERNERKLI